MPRCYDGLLKLVLFSHLFLALACSKPAPTEDETFIPYAYPAGQPDGVAVQQSIGPAGGTITSRDGKFKLTIPSGAVSASTVISVQAISNTLPLGTGPSYRILPADLQLSKPVSLSFTYSDADLDGLDEDALDLAAQDQSGTWKRLKNSTLNKSGRTVSASSIHAGDFSFTGSYRLVPAKSALGAGEKSQLTVYMVQEKAGSNDDEEAVFGAAVPLEDANDLESWLASGPGNIEPGGSTAEFTAPSVISSPETVEVTVAVKSVRRLPRISGGKLHLRRKIQLAPESFMAGYYDGQPFTCIGVSVLVGGGITTVQGVTADGKSVLIILNGMDIGNYPIGSPSQTGKAEIRCNISGDVYETVYTQCGPPSVTSYAGGGVMVKGFQSAGGTIAGEFSSTLYDDSGCQLKNKAISGSFRARR